MKCENQGSTTFEILGTMEFVRFVVHPTELQVGTDPSYKQWDQSNPSLGYTVTTHFPE